MSYLEDVAAAVRSPYRHQNRLMGHTTDLPRKGQQKEGERPAMSPVFVLNEKLRNQIEFLKKELQECKEAAANKRCCIYTQSGTMPCYYLCTPNPQVSYFVDDAFRRFAPLLTAAPASTTTKKKEISTACTTAE